MAARVEGHIDHSKEELGEIRDLVGVKVNEHALIGEDLDHVIARHREVIGAELARLQRREERLVAVVGIHGDLDVVFLGELVDELLGSSIRTSYRAAGWPSAQVRRRSAMKADRGGSEGRISSGWLHCWLVGWSCHEVVRARSARPCPARPISQGERDEKRRDRQHQRRDRHDIGFDPLFDGAEDRGGQGLDARALDEIGDQEVIERDDEGEQEPERIPGARSGISTSLKASRGEA